IVRPVDRCVYAKTGETEIGVGPLRYSFAERKIITAILDRRCSPVCDFEHINAILVEEAAVEKLRFERQLLAAPQRMFGQEADRSVLIIVEVLQRVGQLLVWRFE